MPGLDPTQAQPIAPIAGLTAIELAVVPDVSGLTVTPGELTGQSETLKRLPGVSASLAPEAAAGVELAKVVLTIMTGSIIGLVLYLTLADILEGQRTSHVYDQILKQAGAGSEYSDPESIETVISMFKQGMDNKDYVLSESDAQTAKSIASTLLQFKMLSDDQRVALAKCLPLPVDGNRNITLTSCIDLLTLEEKVARGAAASVEKLRLMIGFSKDVDLRHQGLYSFWIQISQVVLLNLLLPLLTGLFGYIFGTRQERNAAGS